MKSTRFLVQWGCALLLSLGPVQAAEPVYGSQLMTRQ